MTPAPSRHRWQDVLVLAAGLSVVLAFRCPGPEPEAGPEVGGGPTGGGGGGECDPDAPPLDDPQNCGACGRVCAPDAVTQPSCFMGACDSLCDATHVNLTRPVAPAPDDGCEASGRRVFVTPQPVLPDFGGVMQADGICQNIADMGHLGGMFRAWVSTQSSDVATRFTHPGVPYVLGSGAVIAANWAGLVSGTLLHPIDEGPAGMQLPSTETWTGTFENGVYSGLDCSGWTSTVLEVFGSVGLTANTQSGQDIGWSEVYLQNCDRTNVHLYCFQQ